MCQIIVAKAGKEINIEKLNKAEKHNPDGFGVSWFEEGQINTYRTMDFDRLKEMVASLGGFTKIVHLRHTTCGSTDITNTHPFDIPSGVMFHNGTISSLSSYHFKGKDSDTKRLATLISLCEYSVISDIKPLLMPLIGTDINRLVFLEDTGEITIMMEDLGVWEDGIWYSNDYHSKPEWWSRTQTTKPYVKKEAASKPLQKAGDWVKDPEKEGFIRQADLDKREEASGKKLQQDTKATTVDKTLTKVFVYGTLKRGYGNNRLLKYATYLGKASTTGKWNMIGKDMPFPYLLNFDSVTGSNIIGEVYECDVNTMRALDNLEGVPNHYRQLSLNVQYEDTKETVVVKTYVKASRNEEWVQHQELISEWSK